ncbi:AIPR family protein [Nitrosomonas sp. Nm132]|uniref:AIPR family protein n=1 Tax=Nitrosomonas sp. Nm132 TaxID=1881053 RepID=UPI0008836C89|nr:AIPR family protein [Nitrosomonas sp. Nm132]SDH26618.1 AIPR protein [Nitrosomonas sp. Nm132]
MSKNNQILLEATVEQELAHYEEDISLSDFFEFYASLQVLKDFELSFDEINSGICGKSHDGGTDSIYLFTNGELVKEDENIKDKYKKNVDIEFFLIQAKYENSFNENPLIKLTKLCRNLFDLDFDRAKFEGRYNDKVLASFELFRSTYVALITKKPKLKIIVYYVSKGIDIHPNVQMQADELKKDIVEKLPGAFVDVNFIGADQLMKLTQERVNDVFRLKISETPLSTSEQVFIVLTNLAEYYKFITDDNGKLIKHIFESNVRDYQGKNNVNNEIQDTLENPGTEEFWWLNNGVTILASEASAPGGKELVIHNPEIVNGLQTSNEIFRFFSNNNQNLENEKRDVLIRVIVPENEETRDRIIRATNSQTPIPKASLRATDQIHRQIEEYLKPKGLFYDRRKNYYKNEGKKPKDIVSIPFMSQCLMSSLMQKPDYARARPSTLLEDDDSYNKLFHENNDLNTYYLLASWGRQIEVELKSSRQYDPTEINDIKFYVLYAVTAQIVCNIYPTNSTVAKLDIKQATPNLINNSIVLVFDLYKKLGGNDKVAKGIKLIEELKEKLRSIIET